MSIMWDLDVVTQGYLFACRQYASATPANEAERLEKWRTAWNHLKTLHEKASQHAPTNGTRHGPSTNETKTSPEEAQDDRLDDLRGLREL